MSGFTPGPWTFWFTREPSDEMGTNFHLGPEGDEYAGVSHTILEGGLVLEDDNENEANARLIAAAPELYEALEVLLERWVASGLSDEDATNFSLAALAKARGGQ